MTCIEIFLSLRILEGKFLMIINNNRIVRTGPKKLIILILKKKTRPVIVSFNKL